jgi:redox-sensitive bicupin YhaK (pirin superfamily)
MTVVRVLDAPTEDLGGFQVRRALPQTDLAAVGPWVFFDHFGPTEFGPGPGIDVRPHPHINLATVTYLFDGEILHRDSLGSLQAIRPGDINLMIAGRGIVHSERETESARLVRRGLHGLQLWLALPRDDEECDPAFLHYPADSVPSGEVDGVPVRVMLGSAFGLTSPVRTLSPTLYAEARPAAGKALPLPLPAESRELAVYPVEGAVTLAGQRLTVGQLAMLGDARGDLRVTADSDAILAIVGGEPLGRRHVWWNFVSSRRERIAQARSDWEAGRFGIIEGDSDDFIPLPRDGGR